VAQLHTLQLSLMCGPGRQSPLRADSFVDWWAAGQPNSTFTLPRHWMPAPRTPLSVTLSFVPLLLSLSPGTGVSAPSPCVGCYMRGDRASNPLLMRAERPGLVVWGPQPGIYGSRAPFWPSSRAGAGHRDLGARGETIAVGWEERTASIDSSLGRPYGLGAWTRGFLVAHGACTMG
jgi:hypothetical protein